MKKSKNLGPTFIFKMYYVEDLKKRYKHGITEDWTCHGINELKKVLAESLDLRKGADGYPVKATLEDLTSSLGKYADEKFIKQEFSRQKKSYKVYEKLMKLAEDPTCNAYIDLDKHTTYSLYRDNGI